MRELLALEGMKPEIIARLTVNHRRLRELRYALEDAVGPVEATLSGPATVRARKEPHASGIELWSA
jgi:hypothetical protein